jgi:solute carrier family 35, member C2
MESMAPPGQRRRRSSLMNGRNGRSSRPRAQSLRSQGSPHEEPKISEEDAERHDSAHESLSDEDLHDDEETGLTEQDRRRKRQRVLRNTHLDQRIARDNITAEEKKEADKNVIRKLAINCALILLWYIFSLCISLVRPPALLTFFHGETDMPQYNKWMFDDKLLNFKFPLFTTSLHMLVQFALASLVLYLVPSLRPQNRHTSDLGRSRHESEPDRSIMTKTFYLTRIGPCGAATGLDIGLGNMSLQTITLTFYSKAVKSTRCPYCDY